MSLNYCVNIHFACPFNRLRLFSSVSVEQYLNCERTADSDFIQGHGNWESLVVGLFSNRDPIGFQQRRRKMPPKLFSHGSVSCFKIVEPAEDEAC